MSPNEIESLLAALSAGDANVAKKYLEKIQQQFKQLEIFEPFGNTMDIKILLVKCYRVLGNKRN